MFRMSGAGPQLITPPEPRKFARGTVVSSIAEAGRIAVVEDTARSPFARAWARSMLMRAAAVIVGSTALGLMFMFPMWSMGWKQDLSLWWAWGLLVPLIVMVDRRLPYTGRQFGRRAIAQAVATPVFTVIYVHVLFALRIALGDPSLPGGAHWTLLEPAHMLKYGAGWFMWSCLLYWMIVGALQAYRYYERYMSSELRLERMEKSYSQARLNALRMQLDPHFLFNALNTISSHVERDPKLTRRMIEHLGDLLRMSLESKDRQEVPLAEELAFLDHYLEIQRIRFGKQLKVDIQIAPGVRYASVPCLFLQPLVENAIRHGISRRSSGGTVTVIAEAAHETLSIRVADDGVGLPTGWTLENSPGLGLSVTRERIAGMYPDGTSSFSVRSREQGGTVVEITLPLRLNGEETDDGSA